VTVSAVGFMTLHGITCVSFKISRTVNARVAIAAAAVVQAEV